MKNGVKTKKWRNSESKKKTKNNQMRIGKRFGALKIY